jgi:lipoprotein-anchoring transpeptidase ErfK/SrfK
VKAPTLAHRIGVVLVATLLIALSATLAWAAANDYQDRGTVPEGVTVAGQSLGGMTETAAREVVERAITTPMTRPLTMTTPTSTVTFDPKGIVSVDVNAMVNEAYASRRSAPLIARVQHELAGTPLPYEVKPLYSVDASAVQTWVDAQASAIDTRPVNAKRKVVKYAFAISPSAPGYRVDKATTAATISQALSAESALESGARVASMTVAVIPPKIHESSFKKAIIVSLSQRKIRLYEGATLVKTYPCAIGQAAYPTPTGDFYIEGKRYMPTWTNPHASWSANMPESIGPGYSNPLGTRAIDLSASGIRFHGTSKDFSVGEAASHGCMRMHMWDVEDLFKRVVVKEPVFIRY